MSHDILDRLHAPYGLLSRLVMLGTVHLDPRGAERLSNFLGRFLPDLILIEMSPYALRYRRSNRRTLLKKMDRNLREAARHCHMPLHQARRHPEIHFIRKQIALPYEYRAAAAHARRKGIKLILVDRSGSSRELISSWAELIDPQNLSSLLTVSPIRRSVAAAYHSAAQRIHGHASVPSQTLEALDAKQREFWEAREIYMAHRVVTALESYDSSRPLYVGGFQHLTAGDQIPTLREILGISQKRCLLLDTAVDALTGPATLSIGGVPPSD